MKNLWLFLGSVSGFLSVAFGAFGAHALKDKLSASALTVYQTASQYQMIHALALVAVGVWSMYLGNGNTPRGLTLAGSAFAIGTLLFSGSLYALALSGVRALGAITPLGGLCFLFGWLSLAWVALKG
jgi:uncharacterized membrane protein YgdD (TMEM256/DUF423 family)